MAAVSSRVSLVRKTPNEIIEIIKSLYNDCQLPSYFEDDLIRTIDRNEKNAFKPLVQFIMKHPIHRLNRGFLKYSSWFDDDFKVDGMVEEKVDKKVEEKKVVEKVEEKKIDKKVEEKKVDEKTKILVGEAELLITNKDYEMALELYLNVLQQKIYPRERTFLPVMAGVLMHHLKLDDLDLAGKIIQLLEQCGRNGEATAWQEKILKLLPQKETHDDVIAALKRRKDVMIDKQQFYSKKLYLKGPFSWKKYRNAESPEPSVRVFDEVRKQLVTVIELLGDTRISISNLDCPLPDKLYKMLQFTEDHYLYNLEKIDLEYDKLDYHRGDESFDELLLNAQKVAKELSNYKFVDNEVSSMLLLNLFVYVSPFVTIPWMKDGSDGLLNEIIDFKAELKDVNVTCLDENIITSYMDVLCARYVDTDGFLVLIKYISSVPIVQNCIKNKFLVNAINFTSEFSTEVFMLIPYYFLDGLTIEQALDLLATTTNLKACGYKLATLIHQTLKDYTGPLNISKETFDDRMQKLINFIKL